MIQEIINKWEENKLKLEEYFRATKQDEYDSYEKILRKVFELVINVDEDEDNTFSLDKMTIIDDGHYQGTQIFIIPKNTCQPSTEDYVVTDTYYGSCSGCDTLQSILHYDYELTTEEQIRDYMMLALHFIQKMKYLSENED